VECRGSDGRGPNKVEPRRPIRLSSTARPVAQIHSTPADVLEDYYGFAEQPFSLTPDPRFFFRSEAHERALEDLHRAIRRREGFMLLTGDIGTGKTTLCRTLLDQLDDRTFTALVLNPFVTEEELLRVILLDFGVVSREEARRGALAGSTKQDLVAVLDQFLVSLAGLGASAVLVIDEAQNLPAATLEQVRVLTNLETDRQKLLQIVLVGQLNLVTILADPGMRQLDQRISRRCQLQPLDRQETGGYVAHRLHVARGATGVLFTARALDQVHRLSLGVPRMINLLCDRALERGQAVGATRITPSLVLEAGRELALEPPRRRKSDRRKAWLRRWAVRTGVAAAAAAAILAGAWQVVRYYDVPLWPSGSPFTAGAPPISPPAPPAAPAATPSTQVATPPPVVQMSRYSILVGAFQTEAAAAAAAERLTGDGYVVREIAQTEGGEFHVLVGPFTDVALARQQAARLQQDPELGIATIVTER